MNLPVIIKFVIDLLAVLLLALGIKGLSKVKSARDANRLAAFAMSLSVVGLLSITWEHLELLFSLGFGY